MDEAIARRLLEMVSPAEIAVALAAADEVEDRRTRSNRALQLRVEWVRYEAARAERAFHQSKTFTKVGQSNQTGKITRRRTRPPNGF